MLKLKWLWLFVGILCGTVFSASSEERKVESVDLKVAAVSLEDAQERAQEQLTEEGHPALEAKKVLAVFQPTCRTGEGAESLYRCHARVIAQ